MTDPTPKGFRPLLRLLSESGVEYIVVGGVAAFAHGSPRVTFDLDVVYSRTAENIRRVVTCLADYAPYPRGAPFGLPFHFDERTMNFGANFTLNTTLGPIDLLGEIAGGGSYEDLKPFARPAEVYGTTCLCLDLDKLIETKRAAGRPKDFEAIAELETIREEREQGQSS